MPPPPLSAPPWAGRVELWAAGWSPAQASGNPWRAGRSQSRSTGRCAPFPTCGWSWGARCWRSWHRPAAETSPLWWSRSPLSPCSPKPCFYSSGAESVTESSSSPLRHWCCCIKTSLGGPWIRGDALERSNCGRAARRRSKLSEDLWGVFGQPTWIPPQREPLFDRSTSVPDKNLTPPLLLVKWALRVTDSFLRTDRDRISRIQRLVFLQKWAQNILRCNPKKVKRIFPIRRTTWPWITAF